MIYDTISMVEFLIENIDVEFGGKFKKHKNPLISLFVI